VVRIVTEDFLVAAASLEAADLAEDDSKFLRLIKIKKMVTKQLVTIFYCQSLQSKM
jgi:hypothetical protein